MSVSSPWLGIAILSVGFWQNNSAAIRPLRTPPVEKFVVTGGFRDWGPATVTGTTIVLTGKIKWSFRPLRINGSVSTPPAVSGGIAIAPFGSSNPGAVIGVSLATGKEVWRGPDPAASAAVAVHGDLAYVVDKDGIFFALEAATGREVWRVAAFRGGSDCLGVPIVRDDTIYLTGTTMAGSFLLATGQASVMAVDRATGRDRWKPVETRRPVEGRDRLVTFEGLVDAGSVVVAMTNGFLTAFDQATGRMVWEVPGDYSPTQPSTAVAGNVLYFQGSPGTKPAAANRGTLYALDLETRTILWSYSRPTAEPNWAFGAVTPVDGGLWVNSYQALIKLQ